MLTVSGVEEAGDELQSVCARAAGAERDGLRVHYSLSAMCLTGSDV